MELWQKTAYLRAQGLSYVQIERIIYPDAQPNSHMPTISKHVARAEQQGLLKAVSVFNDEGLSEAEMIELQCLMISDSLESALKDRSGRVLSGLKVFHSGFGQPQDRPTWRLKLADFSGRAARTVLGLLARAKQGIAVAWGLQLWEMAAAMERLRVVDERTRKFDRNTVVFPTVGIPLGPYESSSQWSSTNLARCVDRALGNQREVPSLDSVLSVIPNKFREGNRRAIVLELLREFPGYRDVFGAASEEPGLIGQADALLTSAGDLGNWKVFGNEIIQAQGTSIADLKQFVAGDIGGVLISRAQQQCARIEELQEQWTCIKLKHIHKINENADRSNGPGVILCAVGNYKAEIIWELLTQQRVIRHLIIDLKLADELAQKAGVAVPSRANLQTDQPSR